jgi:UDP-N-acetylglucosamine--dolichyl-phosphate N-acetylglucosaminephosphotransferase
MEVRHQLSLLILVILNVVLTSFLLRLVGDLFLSRGISGRDVNKPGMPSVPEEGGIAVAVGLAVTMGLYGYFHEYRWTPLFVMTSLMISVLGLLDHIKNIRPYPKVIFSGAVGALYALIPLSDPATTAGDAITALIVIGAVYAILVNAVNLLAGFNGLESGLAAMSGTALSIFLWSRGHLHEASLALLVAVGYAVFYYFNRYPARIFVGNSGTLLSASVYVGLATATGEWIPLLFILAPHIVNAGIRLFSTGVSSRSQFAPLIYREGLLHLPERSYLSLIRMYLRSGPKHERQIVRYVFMLEVASCLLMFLVLR